MPKDFLYAIPSAYNTSSMYRYNPKDSTSINSNTILAILEDHTGMVWVGTAEGLCSLDLAIKRFKRYPYRTDREFTTPTNNGILDDGGIQSIFEDRENNLWIGTNHGGLNRFDRKNDRFISYFSRENKYLHCIITLFEDHLGKLWAGTAFNGVIIFDRRSDTIISYINERLGLIFN